MGLLIHVNILGYTVPNGWTIRQITNSEYIPIQNEIKMSGDNIVWQEYVDGQSKQIMFWNGNTIAQISDGSNIRSSIQISGNNVIWLESVGGKNQVMLWNGSSVLQISKGTNSCDSPQISDTNIVWLEDIGGKYKVMLWDGTHIIQISNGINDCYRPQISGNIAVWAENINDKYQVMLWNGSTVSQISGGTNSCSSPQISGNIVIWNEHIGNHNQIILWNGIITKQLSSGNSENHKISNSNVVWLQYIDNDAKQIMFWNGSSVKRLRTLMGKYYTEVFLSGTNLCCMEGLTWTNDTQTIYYSDGSIYYKLTDIVAAPYYPDIIAISETSIAFCAYDEDYNAQIYLIQKKEDTNPTDPLVSDINKDNKVDLGDLSILATEWLRGTK